MVISPMELVDSTVSEHIQEKQKRAATIVFANHKGGVAKTTTVASLGAALAERGQKVLVVDLDPQAASTWVLGVEPERVQRSVQDVLSSGRRGAAKKAVMATEWGHLVDVVPSVGGLQAMESIKGGGLDQLLFGSKPTTRLRSALEGVVDGYGVVLVDCPPSLGDLTTNGLAAAAARDGTSDGWACDVPGSVPSLMRTMDAAISGRGFRPSISPTRLMTLS